MLSISWPSVPGLSPAAAGSQPPVAARRQAQNGRNGQFLPYLGTCTRLLALGRSFYGALCGSNAPLTANFPSGVTYQRNADWEHGQLLGFSGFTTVRVSIDPFFAAWTDDPETCAISLL